MQKLDRETWLTECAQFILDDIIAPHCDIPNTQFRISIGFPSGKPSKVLAQCWKTEASADGVSEIFVSPTVDDSIDILAALTHELIHFTDNCASGHQNHFAKVARLVGLEGKLTATVAGQDLQTLLALYVDLLGPIPHAKLDATLSGKPKQKTRMLKVECNDQACGFSFRTTQTHIDALHAESICPACSASFLKLAE